jgi:hypothetical protein
MQLFAARSLHEGKRRRTKGGQGFGRCGNKNALAYECDKVLRACPDVSLNKNFHLKFLA